jgi:hypothetical protein
MPKTYGARSMRKQRESRCTSKSTVQRDRTSGTPKRRDPLGTSPGACSMSARPHPNNHPQRASAKGSATESNRRSRTQDGRNVRSVEVAGIVARERVVTEDDAFEFGGGGGSPSARTQINRVSGIAPEALNHREGHVLPPSRCTTNTALPQVESTEGHRMTTIISSLENVSLEEALAYLDTAEGDELEAAFALARDRNHLDGSNSEPDEAEVHHALFLLRRARGLTAPSFDLLRVQLRERVAA